MKAIISFLKALAVASGVGLLLGCIAGILLSFPYYTSLVLPFGLVQLPGLVAMVTTGIIPQYSDYNTWPHWVPLFHLLAVSIYYSLAILGYGYCGFTAAKRTGSMEKGLKAAFWASLVTTGTTAVVMVLAVIFQSTAGLESVGASLPTCFGLSLLMGIASGLVAALSGVIGSMIGSKETGDRLARVSREAP